MRTEVNKISLEIVLANKNFQDWLISADFIQRKGEPLSEDGLSLIPRRSYPKRGISALATLLNNEGYLVSSRMLIRELYGISSGEGEKRAFYAAMGRLKDSMIYPHNLYHADGIGWGVGITEHKFTPAGLLVTYSLWENLGQVTPMEHISSFVYGNPNEKVKTIEEVGTLRREALPHTRASIRTVGHGGAFRGYQLEEKREEQGLAPFPEYLTPEMQEWLIENGLMERTGTEIQKDLVLDRVSGSEERVRLAECLIDNQGLILSSEQLARYMFNLPRDSEVTQEMTNSVTQQFYVVRALSGVRNEFFAAFNVGKAVGVSKFDPTLTELLILASLKSSPNQIISYSEWEGVHSVYRDAPLDLRRNLNSMRRKLLSKTKIQIVTSNGLARLVE